MSRWVVEAIVGLSLLISAGAVQVVHNVTTGIW